MKFTIRKKFLFGLFISGIVLSACVSPEQEDPFEKLPEEKIETLSGEIFPFSSSVSTRASHRLEKEGKLVAYLASKIVRLDDFEGRKVEVDGVRRTEKMREIFWVEGIRLTDLVTEEAKLEMDKRYKTKRFIFTFPDQWEYSSPTDSSAHFVEKTDENRRVFLTFTVGEPTLVEEKMESNVLIAHLEGIKRVKVLDNGEERQEIILRSNLYPNTKYHFVFTASPSEFEKKKAFSKLLNGFQEGEDKVLTAVEEDQRILAEFEAEKARRQKAKEEAERLMAQTEKEIAEAETKAENEADKSLIDRLLADKEEENPNITEIEATPETGTVSEPMLVKETASIPVTGEYENLIDENAFLYESSHLGLSLKVPANHWFFHFGAGADSLADIGFATHTVSSRSDVEFMMKILASPNPPEALTESANDGELTIIMPRDEKSYFQIKGPMKFRDAMRSVLGSVKNY